MPSQQSIVAPAGYVPQFAISFGEGEAIGVSRDRPLPIQSRTRVAESVVERVAREGSQATNTYFKGDNSGTSYSVGQALGVYTPPPGRSTWIEAITICSTRDVTIWIQRLDAQLNANAAGPALQAVMVGPTFGATTVVPVNGFLREGESLSYVLRTAVPQNAGADFSFFCGMQGRLVSNDFFHEAPRTMLVLGDSISTTTIGGGNAYGGDFFHAHLATSLRSEGKDIRRIVKGDGGWRARHGATAMRRGSLNVGELDLLLVMLGTNDTSISEFTDNLAALVQWKKNQYPATPMVLLAPAPRLDAAEATYLVPLRAAADGLVTQLADPLVHLVDCGNAFAANSANLPDNVHPSAAAHVAIANHVRSALLANGVWQAL
ncbi:SGNH/GDSL hydrolase family protein [Qipengyuania soli]|uniref:SGNH/GDSL hydrolase family protein n=1 Tax=Qipengyuania soli TaxID=2782568 RepID=A0A7S8IWR0_9SPHN|nr:SGNH/GDSL hydrolase family protein [Qipengyuania soli]QPD00307.1 SGNH/GDSL hydrolase family protein [Qipengyuania soli]